MTPLLWPFNEQTWKASPPERNARNIKTQSNNIANKITLYDNNILKIFRIIRVHKSVLEKQQQQTTEWQQEINNKKRCCGKKIAVWGNETIRNTFHCIDDMLLFANYPCISPHPGNFWCIIFNPIKGSFLAYSVVCI